MAKYLVIVESPAKAKTIKKYLGKNYEVVASEGHVRDLPKSTMGIDVENDFEPRYINIRGKGDLIAALRKEVKKSDKVYLATDPDREGEAISYHLVTALKLENDNYKRITFNEITKNAVKASIKNARDIDMDLVDAQQARRVLDRFVGYEISPVLWKKVKRGLSAGRVQSSALKIIADREAQIAAFIPKEYWTYEVELKDKNKESFVFKYSEELPDEDAVKQLTKRLEGKDYVVESIKKSTRTKKQPLPFTTSTLQQTAARKLNMTTSRVMRIAQSLYENGYITYLRTDSTRVSEEADKAAREYIKNEYGEEYVIQGEPVSKNSKNAQDAHEAIRPTSLENNGSSLKTKLGRDELRIYSLIYSRFLASRMQPAVYDNISVTVKAGDDSFKAGSSVISFKGFLAVYTADETEDEKTIGRLDRLSENEKLDFVKYDDKQHFTSPPAHFTESLLVKTMEENGIGRPSTYAPTISTLLNRRYVIKENKNLYITALGEAVNGIMEQAFPEIVNVEFTANMESLLDSISEGGIDWKVVIRNFYEDLDVAVKNAEEKLENVNVADEVSDVECEECGRMMVIKYGPHGKFLACPGFPECRNTKPFFEKIGIECPRCGSDIVIKSTKKGRRYYGCTNYPECDFMVWQRPKDKDDAARLDELRKKTDKAED